jgi:single-strand DNA-binding protein
MSVNKVILVGRLGKDPEVRELENGVKVANFSIATTKKYKDSTGAKAEKTEWHNIVAWRSLADISAKYLHKGDLVYVEGELQTREWEKDNIKRYRTDVVISEMTMLGGGGKNSSTSDATATSAPEVELTSASGSTDDLPF